MTLKLEFTFDPNNYRHYMNGIMSVLHCHHYMTLTTKTAMDYAAIGAINILAESAEDAVRPLFDSYCEKNGVANSFDRLAVGAEFYSVMGMGKMNASGTEQGGEVTLSHSHVDAGWIKKWGATDKPVNYFSCGYIAAMFAAAFKKPARSYKVVETASIVKGDAVSRFIVTAI